VVERAWTQICDSSVGGSGDVVAPLRLRFSAVTVVAVTAPIDVLRQRLAARNRPSDGDLAERIARSEALTGELDADVVIVNVDTPEAAAAQLFNVVRPSHTRQ
jgi:ribose 1,5-bisphosphokinase